MTPPLRDNPVKTALAAGKRSFGAMVFEFFSPGLPQICRNAGADFVLYDMEHTGLGFETLKTQFALCRGLGIVPMVRVPRGEYHFIARALDVGAMGVMVPMVGSAEEAASIVACTRYPPAGRRGAAFGFAHDDYGSGNVRDKIAAQGFNIITSTPDELAAYIRSEHEKWGKLVKVSGAKVE